MSFNLRPKKEKIIVKVKMLEDITYESPTGEKTILAKDTIQELPERIAMKWFFTGFCEATEE